MMHAITQIIRQMLKGNSIDLLKRNGLTVGADCYIGDVYIDPSHTWLITLGDQVSLNTGVRILANDASTKRHLGMTRLGKITIGDRVFIGAFVTILPGVTIGSDVVIGAGSVVTKDIPGECVAAGNPARVRCTIQEFMERRREEMKRVPQFGFDYTLAGKITPAKKEDMQEQIHQFGYIV